MVKEVWMTDERGRGGLTPDIIYVESTVKKTPHHSVLLL